MKKTVYLYDETGRYNGKYDAQESPLEPGTFIVPARSTDVAPPSVGGNQFAQWDGTQWLVEDVATPPGPAPYSPAIGDTNYRALIRRRAEKLVSQGRQYDALLLLKTIGE